MRAFRFAVGTFVVQAKDIRAEQFDADAIVNVVNQVQNEMENMMENFENLKKSVFKGLDADNNGFITKEELQAKVKQYLGPDPVPAQVTEEIFNVLDMNGDNQVEADEIVEGELGAKFAAESQRVQQLIADFLSGPGLEETLKATVGDMVEAVEVDQLNREDFKNYFLSTVKQFPESEPIAAQLLELFDKLDTDESGVVTKEEVKAAVEALTQIFAEQAKDLMAGLLH